MKLHVKDEKSYKKSIRLLDNILANELKRIKKEEKNVIKQINSIKNNLEKQYNALQKHRRKEKISA